MSTNTYQMAEVVGTSPIGVTEAVNNGIAKVAETTKNISLFEMTQARGHITDGKFSYYQVSMKIGHSLQ